MPITGVGLSRVRDRLAARSGDGYNCAANGPWLGAVSLHSPAGRSLEVKPGQSAHQLLCLEGLWNHGVCPKRLGHPQVIDLPVPCTTRNSDDLDLRTLAPDLEDGFDTLLLGHDDVGDHDIGALLAEDGHRPHTVRSGHYIVPVTVKDPRKRVPDQLVVVDYQDL